jgi:hypothetical protein
MKTGAQHGPLPVIFAATRPDLQQLVAEWKRARFEIEDSPCPTCDDEINTAVEQAEAIAALLLSMRATTPADVEAKAAAIKELLGDCDENSIVDAVISSLLDDLRALVAR